MNSFYDIVSDLQKESEKIDSLHDLLQRIARQTTECCYFIHDYAKAEDFFDWPFGIKIDASETKDLAMETKALVEETKLVVTHILDDIEVIVTDISLDDIPYANDANFDETKACQLGTRVEILDEITDWINAEGAPRILLLSGAAGTGKSAIAHTIAHRFNTMHRLGSSFFFVRGRKDRGPDKLFPTVARDLADLDKGIRHALYDIVTANKFDNLILKSVEKLTIAGPLVIVIDSLDECGDAKIRADLLQALANKTKALPTNFRILLTSRPEADVKSLFQADKHVIIKRMQELSSSTEADVSLYIHNRLSNLEVYGIENRCKGVLVAKCEGLFQWASAACEFIKGWGAGLTHKERYELIVQGKTDESWPLDHLYQTVLSYLFPPKNSAVMDRFRLVMSLVLTAFEPLSVKALNEILYAAKDGNPGFEVNVILEYMGSLLSGVTGDDVVCPLHTSFRDFLLAPSHSNDFYIDTSDTHAEFTVASLSILKRQLSFNICRLESSYVANRDIYDLADRINRYIPAHLSYSCRFWADHLQTTAANVASGHKVLQDLEVVLTDKFLFWLEFPMSQSTPHIYLSALPFAPQNSTAFEMFGKNFSQVLRISAGAGKHWPIVEHIMHARSVVLCVAFSPDGLRIVSGSHDGKIRVWNAAMGATVGEPFEGHTGGVNSVVFSPDGLRIVSGSDDSTIRVWIAETDAALGDPIDGHTSKVNSVAFSQDGLQIVSCSNDCTVHVWIAETGDAVGEPLEGHANWGHTDFVNSVAFSPDALRIVSGSSDKTIRVWDVTSMISDIGGSQVVLRSDNNSHNVPTRLFVPLLMSPRLEHAMRIDVIDNAATPPRDYRQSEDMNDDGWIVGPASELLFWVPPAYRDRLLPGARLKMIIGRKVVQLDLSQFIHGTSWHECYRPSQPQ
ncbi:hypothetical protein HETIRDRAFT_105708 [Heterobasidion irregulare TC 32-1]|uniref:NACHT domain-containing protein n=1 Tax=Heterobasidion irregulare (strain TC 32-1) TaxID=747525 RepID=W4JVI4_HETIT|nr:uncharacterized protein HETIRDRAFT_105708 [Heterobasidion irregulare TC 32-1]ETW77090.1 hypothetical protein HETIRDRAFT_105708 [Heterobasidion irregulare TC 32-1]